MRDIGRVELAKRDYSIAEPHERQDRDHHRHLPAARRQRGGDRARRCARGMEELKTQFPTGLDYKIALDTSLFTLNSIDKVVHTFFEAVVLVIAGGVPVPAVAARHHHPDPRGAGVDHRHLHRHAPARLLDQHADDVRHDPRDRPGGRRRHRGGRERRDQHDQARPRRARGREAGDDRDRRRADLDRAGAGGGVPAGGVPRRRHRHALPAVRDHHRHLGGDLRASWR